MGLAKSFAVTFVRPVYRLFFERPLWWFLSRVKAYFFAEVGVQLADIGKKLIEMDRNLAEINHRLAQIEQRPAVQQPLQSWTPLEARLQTIDANNAAQWDAMEQLLLAMFRQSEAKTETVNHSTPVNTLPALAPARAHAASNIR